MTFSRVDPCPICSCKGLGNHDDTAIATSPLVRYIVRLCDESLRQDLRAVHSCVVLTIYTSCPWAPSLSILSLLSFPIISSYLTLVQFHQVDNMAPPPNATMNQWVITATDKGFDGLKYEEVPLPKPGDNEVLVKLYGASLNYRDLAILKVSGIPSGSPVHTTCQF